MNDHRFTTPLIKRFKYNLYADNKENNKSFLCYEFYDNNTFETCKKFFSNSNIKIENEEIKYNENNNITTYNLFIDYKYHYINNFKFNINLLFALFVSVKYFYKNTGKYININLNYMQISFIGCFVYDINFKNNKFKNLIINYLIN